MNIKVQSYDIQYTTSIIIPPDVMMDIEDELHDCFHTELSEGKKEGTVQDLYYETNFDV